MNAVATTNVIVVVVFAVEDKGLPGLIQDYGTKPTGIATKLFDEPHLIILPADFIIGLMFPAGVLASWHRRWLSGFALSGHGVFGIVLIYGRGPLCWWYGSPLLLMAFWV